MPHAMKHAPIEANWYATRDYRKLFHQVPGAGHGGRRLLLLSVALARRASERMTVPACRLALDIAELAAEVIFSDSEIAVEMLTTVYELRLSDKYRDSAIDDYFYDAAAHAHQKSVGCKSDDRIAMWAANPNTWWGFTEVAKLFVIMQSSGDRETARRQKGIVADLVRDVHEPPVEGDFPKVGVKSPQAVVLAESMYLANDFSAMPKLGELLAEAGCHDRSVLAHCRGTGPHIRGCWVVDQVLGKRESGPKPLT